MTQQLKPDEISPSNSVNQKLDINDSHIIDTEISQAGRDYLKAEGNITSAQYLQQNYYVQKIISSPFKKESDLGTLRELERAVESKYSEKFYQVASIVYELRTQVERQRAALPERYRDEALRLLSDLQSIVGHEDDLEQIREELVLYRKAHNWLSDNAEHLVNLASAKVFSGEYQHLLNPRQNFLGFNKIKAKDVHTSETKRQFFNDLSTYLGWILAYMPNGSNPKDFNRYFVNLDFEDAVYKQAFEIIKNDGVDPEISNLSEDEARIIARYINKFIIDRNLSKDARIFFRG